MSCERVTFIFFGVHYMKSNPETQQDRHSKPALLGFSNTVFVPGHRTLLTCIQAFLKFRSPQRTVSMLATSYDLDKAIA